MEANVLGGGLFPAMGSAGMLGLEMPLHQNHSNSQTPRHLQPPQMMAYAQHDPDHRHPQAQPSPLKHGGFTYGTAAKSKQVNVSDEDEPGLSADHDRANTDGKGKMSPWQRMKWSDNMVRYLILAVFYIGDDGGAVAVAGSGGLDGTDPAARKKPPGGLLQKKGKWKTVSLAMIEKGYYVSPQQCEDKFNDLNKRFKRVNDILGKGTACKVVENRSLLDSIDLTPKMKEEVRKLLNSKHLFYREMCSYHNSCGHGFPPGVSKGPHYSRELALDQLSSSFQPNQEDKLAQAVANLARQRAEASKTAKTAIAGEDEEDEDEDSYDEEEEEEDDEAERGSRSQFQSGRGHDQDDDDTYEGPQPKRPRKEPAISGTTQQMQQFSCEILGVVQDGAKSVSEKKQWLRMRMIQLEEQQVSYQIEAFELEKQKLKWLKFTSKKEREMEKARFENERRKLENERMLLIIRQKELEVLDLLRQNHHHHQQQQHSSNKRCCDPSSNTV